MKKFARNKQLIRLISVGEGIKVVDELKKFNLEKTIFGDPNKDTDNNVPFHADIHFHSHKVLFYMSDVTEEGGPFIYCKNSHLNNLDRLWFEFKRGQLKDAHIEGWRIQQHLDKKFFNNYFSKLKNKEYKVACPANTLVIANVHGFHKRGESISGVERSLIRIPLRYNPLGPIGSIPSNLYSGSFFLEDMLINFKRFKKILLISFLAFLTGCAYTLDPSYSPTGYKLLNKKHLEKMIILIEYL